jgi:hypothetical protein
LRIPEGNINFPSSVVALFASLLSSAPRVKQN